LLFSELLLEGRKKQFVDAWMNRMTLFLSTEPDILAYMHYIGDSYPASLTSFAENMCSKIFILPLGRKFVSDEAHMKLRAKN
jgi:hypothetical protein